MGSLESANKVCSLCRRFNESRRCLFPTYQGGNGACRGRITGYFARVRVQGEEWNFSRDVLAVVEGGSRRDRGFFS